MVINGLSEDNKTFTTPGGTIFDVKQEPVKAETITEEVEPVSDEVITVKPEIKPISATFENPVVERGDTGIKAPDLEFTRDEFVNIQGKQNAGQKLTDDEKLFLGKIKAKRDSGQTVESIFGEQTTTGGLLSESKAQEVAQRLAEGKDARGLPMTPQPDTRLVEILKGQGYSDLEANQIIERKNAILAGTQRKGITQDRIAQQTQLIQQEAEIARKRVEENVTKVQNQTQRLRSLRGVGRGTATENEILDLEKQGIELINAVNTKADLAIQKMRLAEEGAEAETLASIDDQIQKQEILVQQKLTANLEQQRALNDQLALDFDASISTMLGTLEAGGEDITGIDKDKSKGLGYFVNSDGSIYLNNAGNPVEYKTTGAPTTYTPTQIDDFAKGIATGKVKFTDLDLEAGDVSKVLSAMNTKLNDLPGLSTNTLKAERILKDLGLGTDEGSINTVTNLLKVNSEAEVRDLIATDEFKNASFVGGNQKLFDDLRKDADSFKDIDRTFKGMNQIWDDFKNKPAESRAAMEQALIIMFNKMLDPGSVVREGEFDRTSQGQSLLNQAEGWLQKLSAGGAGIKNESFEDIVNIAKVLYDASEDTIGDLKTSYKSFAGDLGADPDFVDRFFEIGFGKDEFGGITTDMSDDDIINKITGGTTTGTGGTTETKTEINKSSSFEDKASFLDGDFNSPDTTGGTNEIPGVGFTEKINIARTGTNVAKDTNNPGNITADSIPSGFTKEEYGKRIGATGTYLSPNGREYFVFPNVASGSKALEGDITAKIQGRSGVIKPTDTLARFQRVYVGEVSPNYLAVLKRITGADDNTPISQIDPGLLTKAVMKAEGFNS